MTGASEHKLACEPFPTFTKLWNEGASLIPTGDTNGKKPLIKFSKNRLPLELIIKKLQQNSSMTYGIRLSNIVVLDIDDPSADLVQQMIDRFGETNFKVSTGRGSHLYYATQKSVRFNLHQEGLKIDVKSGTNSYVIGPNSVRPDGVHYDFTGTELSLAKLPEFHAPNKQQNTRLSKQVNLIPEGQRNQLLLKKALEYAPCVNSFEELHENLLFDRDSYCLNPNTVFGAEVFKIADWAWKKRLSNQLYNNTNSAFKIDREAFHKIYRHQNGRAAWELYMFLSDKHGHVIGKTFQINVKSLLRSYHFHFGEKAMHQAIKFLLELGYLTLVKNYSAGKSGRLFQLSKPLSPDVVALR